MELLGDKQYFYSVKTDKHYKIVNIKNIDDLFTYVVQECEPVLYDRTLGLLDEKKKLTKIIETYELVPIPRKKQMLSKLLNYRNNFLFKKENIPIELDLTDKYIFKDVI